MLHWKRMLTILIPAAVTLFSALGGAFARSTGIFW